MNKTKLNYRFHNPNSPEETANFLCKILVDVNTPKVEEAIKKAAPTTDAGTECDIQLEHAG